ncbi:MAG: helix-turn-helix domain-containing protein [Clostridia bacterium]
MEKSDINRHIGKVCQEYRLKNNLTQNQVSELTGLEPRHISQIERGLSKGSIDTLLKLCNAYKITPDVILYDLLDENTKKSISIYDNDFKKLNKRDKESILFFIKYFLSR